MLNRKNTTAEGTDSSAGKESSTVRQLLKQRRELEEKRKYGLAPLAIDSMTNQEISPNVPHFIAQAPWYFGNIGPTLEHQRKSSSDEANIISLSDKEEPRIKLAEDQPKQYIAGACRNCGSRTHTTRECYLKKKKIGAVYTNKVSGVNISIDQEAIERQRNKDKSTTGAVGVNLLRSISKDNLESDTAREPDGDIDYTSVPKRQRLENIFEQRTAQHGGVDIKPLPKYLYNLETDSFVFDSKTGAMRGDPNSTNPTHQFRGDLERYRTGHYYDYLEVQSRFIKGESKSFVDFEWDDQKRRELEDSLQMQENLAIPTEKGESLEKNMTENPKTESHLLVSALYGRESGDNFSKPSVDVQDKTNVTKGEGHSDGSKVPSRLHRAMALISQHSFDSSYEIKANSSALPSNPRSIPEKGSLNLNLTIDSPKTNIDEKIGNKSLHKDSEFSWPLQRGLRVPGHRAVYGSFFNKATLSWGFSCCRKVGLDAISCSNQKE